MSSISVLAAFSLTPLLGSNLGSYYQELFGGGELPVNPKIDKGNLKEAIRRAYNNKNGTGYESFEEIIENDRLPKS